MFICTALHHKTASTPQHDWLACELCNCRRNGGERRRKKVDNKTRDVHLRLCLRRLKPSDIDRKVNYSEMSRAPTIAACSTFYSPLSVSWIKFPSNVLPRCLSVARERNSSPKNLHRALFNQRIVSHSKRCLRKRIFQLPEVYRGERPSSDWLTTYKSLTFTRIIRGVLCVPAKVRNCFTSLRHSIFKRIIVRKMFVLFRKNILELEMSAHHVSQITTAPICLIKWKLFVLELHLQGWATWDRSGLVGDLHVISVT